jgi:hypothetical protein
MAAVVRLMAELVDIPAGVAGMQLPEAEHPLVAAIAAVVAPPVVVAEAVLAVAEAVEALAAATWVAAAMAVADTGKSVRALNERPVCFSRRAFLCVLMWCRSAP